MCWIRDEDGDGHGHGEDDDDGSDGDNPTISQVIKAERVHFSMEAAKQEQQFEAGGQ